MQKLITLLLVLASSAAVSAQTQSTNVVQNFSTVRFKAIINYEKTGVIIDLRTPEEVAASGFIAGASFIDFTAKDAEKKIDALDKSKTYFIYCASGGRSGDAAEYMEKQGFKRVCVLEKGFDDWKKQGYPVAVK